MLMLMLEAAIPGVTVLAPESFGNEERRRRRTYSTLLDCFCFTKIKLTTSSADIFSRAILVFVLHIKELCSVIERFMGGSTQAIVPEFGHLL